MILTPAYGGKEKQMSSITLVIGEEVKLPNGVIGKVKILPTDENQIVEIESQGVGLKKGDKVIYVVPETMITESSKPTNQEAV